MKRYHRPVRVLVIVAAAFLLPGVSTPGSKANGVGSESGAVPGATQKDSPKYPLKRDDPRAVLPKQFRSAKGIEPRVISETQAKSRSTRFTPVGYDLKARKEIDAELPPAPAGKSRGASLDARADPGSLKLTEASPSPNPVLAARMSGKGKSRAVFGRDERVVIADTTQYPWRTACKLLMKFPNGDFAVGSGSLVGPNAVLTVGHCLYSHESGGWAEEVLVAPGLDGEYMPFGAAEGVRMFTTREWIANQDSDGDFALVLLDDPLGDNVGWMGTTSVARLTGATLHLASYPGDLDDGMRQYYVNGPTVTASATLVFHQLDSTPGTSGGGVFMVFGKNDYRIVAIHAFQTKRSNGATRLTAAKARLLAHWLTKQ